MSALHLRLVDLKKNPHHSSTSAICMYEQPVPVFDVLTWALKLMVRCHTIYDKTWTGLQSAELVQWPLPNVD